MSSAHQHFSSSRSLLSGFVGRWVVNNDRIVRRRQCSGRRTTCVSRGRAAQAGEILVIAIQKLLDCFRSTPTRPQSSATRVSEASVRSAGQAIRAGEFQCAGLMLSTGDDAVLQTAASLNILGVIAVSESDWNVARDLWRAAVREDSSYLPACQNLRRCFELWEFGHSSISLVLGDERHFRQTIRGDL